MEAARLGLSEYPMGSLGRPGVGSITLGPGGISAGQGLALPMDPWLSPPLLNSTLSHALPGFLSHPQNGYPSYLTPPASAPPNISTLVAAAAAAAAAVAENSKHDGPDPRSSSIATLRLKAKEHVESISKGLQMV
ncbi:hypothetical protein B566_EDAN006559 [Ephemera danica]|nr:hypothetical protein B566_EDAN006559 [Ephemera danica]